MVKDGKIVSAKYDNEQDRRESQQQRETPTDGKGYRHKAFTANDTKHTKSLERTATLKYQGGSATGKAIVL